MEKVAVTSGVLTAGAPPPLPSSTTIHAARSSHEIPFHISASSAVVVNKRAQWIWQRLSDPVWLSQVFTHLFEVRRCGLDDYQWRVAALPEALVCLVRFPVREPPEHLAWHSTAGVLEVSGQIELRPISYQTELRVRLNYRCADPAFCHLLEHRLGDLPEKLRHDLQRAATLLEQPVYQLL